MNPERLIGVSPGDTLEEVFGRRPRILVVDDQPANVQALHQAFAHDHQVFMATSGAQALQVCAAKQPDLVLLDVVMPEMDGYELCSLLKADAHTRDIPVIFVTAHRDEAQESHALEVGAVDFISKPINPTIVRARAKTHLTLKAQSDLLRQWVYMDGLTNVCNRRYFETRLSEEWARSVRQRTPLSVVMIDVDHFKRYNDRYGHQAGDDCLRRLAAEFKAGLQRPTDLVARYGGEEFVCLLAETPLAGRAEGGPAHRPARARGGHRARRRRRIGHRHGEPGRRLASRPAWWAAARPWCGPPTRSCTRPRRVAATRSAARKWPSNEPAAACVRPGPGDCSEQEVALRHRQHGGRLAGQQLAVGAHAVGLRVDLHHRRCRRCAPCRPCAPCGSRAPRPASCVSP